MTTETDEKKLLEGYEKYTSGNLKFQKTPGAPGMTKNKSDLEEPDNINKYRSFVGQLIWYTTKVVPDVANVARYLALHMSHPGTEHLKALGRLIGYLKGKYTKGIIIIKTNVLKAVLFCDSNYATYKETRNSVCGLVATLGGTLPTCSSKTKNTVTLRNTEAEYVDLSACSQEVKFLSMFMVETNKVQNPSVIYEDNQGAIFLAKNRKVGISTKHIDICHHFLRDMMEEKDINIQYMGSEDNPAYILTNNTSGADFARHMKRITERELWELVDTRRDNFNKTKFTDDVITHDKTEYSSEALTEVVDGKNRN